MSRFMLSAKLLKKKTMGKHMENQRGRTVISTPVLSMIHLTLCLNSYCSQESQALCWW